MSDKQAKPAHGPAPAPAPRPRMRMVDIQSIEVGKDGVTVVVWAAVGHKEYGVPFHKPDLDKIEDLEQKQQYVARQVLVAADLGKDEIPPPPEDLRILGIVHVEV